MSSIGVTQEFLWNKQKTNTESTKVKYKDLSQEGMNKIIYDILASDQGLASLALGENISGGYNSTAKAQLVQDFTTKVAETLALIVAPEVNKEDSVVRRDEKESKFTGKFGTVICTEMNRQGLLADELYKHPKALAHFESLPAETVAGYHLWAVPSVPILARSPRLSKYVAAVARARYSMIVTGKWNLLGAITFAAHPVCYLIGKLTGGNNARLIVRT